MATVKREATYSGTTLTLLRQRLDDYDIIPDEEDYDLDYLRTMGVDNKLTYIQKRALGLSIGDLAEAGTSETDFSPSQRLNALGLSVVKTKSGFFHHVDSAKSLSHVQTLGSAVERSPSLTAVTTGVPSPTGSPVGQRRRVKLTQLASTSLTPLKGVGSSNGSARTPTTTTPLSMRTPGGGKRGGLTPLTGKKGDILRRAAMSRRGTLGVDTTPKTPGTPFPNTPHTPLSDLSAYMTPEPQVFTFDQDDLDDSTRTPPRGTQAITTDTGVLHLTPVAHDALKRAQEMLRRRPGSAKVTRTRERTRPRLPARAQSTEPGGAKMYAKANTQYQTFITRNRKGGSSRDHASDKLDLSSMDCNELTPLPARPRSHILRQAKAKTDNRTWSAKAGRGAGSAGGSERVTPLPIGPESAQAQPVPEHGGGWSWKLREALMCEPYDRTAQQLDAIYEHIGSFPALASLSHEVCAALLRALSFQKHDKGTKIYNRGDPADAWFIILHGDVEVDEYIRAQAEAPTRNAVTPQMSRLASNNRATQSEKALSRRSISVVVREDIEEECVLKRRLGTGDDFGSLVNKLQSSEREDAAACLTDVTLLVCHAKDYHRIMKANHQIVQKSRVDFLKGIDMLEGWTDKNLHHLADHMKFTAYAKGDIIIHQDDPCTDILLIYSGTAKVVKRLRIRHDYLSEIDQKKLHEARHTRDVDRIQTKTIRLAQLTFHDHIGSVALYDIHPHLEPSPAVRRLSSASGPSPGQPGVTMSRASSVSVNSGILASASPFPSALSPSIKRRAVSSLNNTGASPPPALRRMDSRQLVMSRRYRSPLGVSVIAETDVEIFKVPKMDFDAFVNDTIKTKLKDNAPAYLRYTEGELQKVFLQRREQKEWERYKVKLRKQMATKLSYSDL